LTSGEVHSQLADVFAQSTPIVLSEKVGVLMGVARLPRARRLARLGENEAGKGLAVDHFSKGFTAGQALEHDDTSCEKQLPQPFAIISLLSDLLLKVIVRLFV
jgi:hypothetical protein